jgi:hypothetical protein
MTPAVALAGDGRGGDRGAGYPRSVRRWRISAPICAQQSS